MASRPGLPYSRVVSGSLSVERSRAGRVARLSDVACTLGRHDRPYPEAHASDAWTIALVRRGTFRYRAADTNRVHVLRAGWLLLGRPGAGFECSHEHDGGDDCTALALTRDVVDEVASATEGCRGPVFRAPVMAPLTRVSALVERARAGGDADPDEIAYLVAEAVVAASHARQRSDPAPRPADRDHVDAAVDLVERASDSPLSLADLAAAAGLSPFHFLRVFRRATGTTPHQYLVGARLRRAARLLLDTARPVTDIAYDVGFEDLSNFVRTFHRHVGCSPRAYRRRR